MSLNDAKEYVENNIKNWSDMKLLEDLGIHFVPQAVTTIRVLCKDIKRYVHCDVFPSGTKVTFQNSGGYENSIRSLFK